MELRFNERSNLIKNSAGFVVFTLIKHIQQLSSVLLRSESASLQEELNDFIIHHPQNSVLSIIYSLIESKSIKFFFTYAGSSPFINISKGTIDNYFDLPHFSETLKNLNLIIIFHIERIDNIIQVLEFIDSKLEFERSKYNLKAIIVKKNNMFGIITQGIHGIVYYKMTSCENFKTWGEAIFSAYEGDFLPMLLVFLRNEEEGVEDFYHFVLDLTMDSIKNMHQIRKYCVKSTHKYEKCYRVVKNDELKNEDLVANEESALKILQSLKESQIS